LICIEDDNNNGSMHSDDEEAGAEAKSDAATDKVNIFHSSL
jgi:hypothetical protein